MTYKKIVQKLIADEADKYIYSLVSNIRYSSAGKPHMEHDNDSDSILWDVVVTIVTDDRTQHKVCVGGTADDLIGICVSCVWDEEKKKLLWMSRQTARKELGIVEFILP